MNFNLFNNKKHHEIESNPEHEKHLEAIRDTYTFLVGGNDLEMNEIRKVLADNNMPFEDKDLSWGASTENYSDEIEQIKQQGKTPVAIELTGAENLENITVIDHHNENSDKKASILQLLEVLDIEPTQDQLFVAANDSGYIPEMKKLGLELGMNKEEIQEKIDEIRLRDRQYQGITMEQELAAERAIENLKIEKIGDHTLTTVNLEHSKSATVTDRLFGQYDQLVIYSDDGETNFFGKGDFCKKLQGEKIGVDENGYDKYDNLGGWSGGGSENGFWGGYADKDEIDRQLREMILADKIIPRYERNQIEIEYLEAQHQNIDHDYKKSWIKGDLRSIGQHALEMIDNNERILQTEKALSEDKEAYNKAVEEKRLAEEEERRKRYEALARAKAEAEELDRSDREAVIISTKEWEQAISIGAKVYSGLGAETVYGRAHHKESILSNGTIVEEITYPIYTGSYMHGFRLNENIPFGQKKTVITRKNGQVIRK